MLVKLPRCTYKYHYNNHWCRFIQQQMLNHGRSFHLIQNMMKTLQRLSNHLKQSNYRHRVLQWNKRTSTLTLTLANCLPWFWTLLLKLIWILLLTLTWTLLLTLTWTLLLTLTWTLLLTLTWTLFHAWPMRPSQVYWFWSWSSIPCFTFMWIWQYYEKYVSVSFSKPMKIQWWFKQEHTY